jgi:hypothetical protein
MAPVQNVKNAVGEDQGTRQVRQARWQVTRVANFVVKGQNGIGIAHS